MSFAFMKKRKKTNLYHLKFLHFFYFIGSCNRKMQMYYDELTKYILIRHFKQMNIFLISLIFWQQNCLVIFNFFNKFIKSPAIHFVSYTLTNKTQTPYYFLLQFLSSLNLFFFFFLIYFISSHERKKEANTPL